MDKQKALELFEKFWEDYDLHVTVQIAQIDNKWPDVILNEGDNDWQQGLYVGWMNAMKARADLAAKRERELVEALRDCVGVMLERVYPKPDAPDSHPWNVARRGQDLLAKIDASRT